MDGGDKFCTKETADRNDSAASLTVERRGQLESRLIGRLLLLHHSILEQSFDWVDEPRELSANESKEKITSTALGDLTVCLEWILQRKNCTKLSSTTSLEARDIIARMSPTQNTPCLLSHQKYDGHEIKKFPNELELVP
ncbi:uncharacterized protein LOC144472019 [Augochlora pura]